MRSLLLILTLIMTLGQAMMPAAASIAVSEHQPMATMNPSASATMTMDMDCCQGQQHCPTAIWVWIAAPWATVPATAHQV